MSSYLWVSARSSAKDGLTSSFRMISGLVLLLHLFHPSVFAQSNQLSKPIRITDVQGLPQAFIPAIVQDHKGFIWAATRDGLCRYDGRNFRVFQPDPTGKPSLSFAGVNTLTLDYQGRIWVISERGDLDLFDPQTELFTNVSRWPAYRQQFGLSRLFGVSLDQQNRLWLAFEGGGVGCINLRTRKISQYRHQLNRPKSLTSDDVMAIVEDKKGRIWAATRQGLNYFDEPTKTFIHYVTDPTLSNTLPDEEIDGLYLHRTGELMISSKHYLILLNVVTGAIRSFPVPIQGNQWRPTQFATDSQGVVYFQQDGTLYRFSDQNGLHLLTEQDDAVAASRCHGLWIDQSDVLWLGTNGAGIRKYDLRAYPFQTAPYHDYFHIDLPVHWLGINPRRLQAFNKNTTGYDFRSTLDGQGALWFNARSNPFQRLNLATGTLTNIALPISGPPEKTQSLYPLATDPQGNVWAVHDSLAWYYESATARWVSFPHPISIRKPTLILQFVVDAQALWLATNDAGLYRIDRRTGAHKRFLHEANDPTSLSSNTLFCLSADPLTANRLWIGTFGSGLCIFDKAKGTSHRLTVADGLPNNVIYSAIPDQQGYLWVSTNKGLARLNRRTLAVRTFTREDGLMDNESNRFHFLYLPGMPPGRRSDHDDRIFLGGIEGITAFYPRQIRDDTFQPAVELTSLAVNNRQVITGRLENASDTTKTLRLPQSIQSTQNLTLEHDQNFLTVGFAALQFNKTDRNHYRHRLEGLDGDWVETDRPEVIYTDLQPGHYVLTVNVSNTSAVWSPHVRKLTITILPPLWATWWAYLIYTLLVLGIGYSRFRAYVNQLRLQQTVLFQQRKAQQQREVDEMKTRFFSNITHEFRTPLTLILTPTQQLQQKYKEAEDQRRLGSIEKNAHQLLGLINQLMDMAKLESRAMGAQESRGDLGEFVGSLVESFREQAESKSINIQYVQFLQGEYWFDREKLERIIYNLLSNALKFTLQHGQVTVQLAVVSDGIQLAVTDTGVGIPADQLPLIFDRFYQVDDSAYRESAAKFQSGTGIGLALVKELVEVQQGQIEVKSEPGMGTTFVVSLPYRPATTANETSDGNFPANYPEHPKVNSHDVLAETAVVLLVEDNDELAEFIAQSLPKTYRIHRAANGADGFAQALRLLPDLVLSDVLMPIMDGYTLCTKLKNDIHTSHIPVILLTAKSALESRMTGLTAGADDYITKPFHLPELQLRVRNLLDGRRRLREWVRQSLSQPDTSEPDSAFGTADTLLPTLYSLLNDRLDDPTFGVDELATQIGMSRASLYRKIRAVSALPVNELIRNYRLKRAAQYLRQGRTVSRTAYSVGFDSPAYFAKCFRELYHLTPTEFIEKRV